MILSRWETTAWSSGERYSVPAKVALADDRAPAVQQSCPLQLRQTQQRNDHHGQPPQRPQPTLAQHSVATAHSSPSSLLFISKALTVLTDVFLAGVVINCLRVFQSFIIR